MQNNDRFTKIQIEPGGFAQGYIRGCTDALEYAHKLLVQNRKECEATGRDPLPIFPSYIIVIRRTAALLLAALSITLCGCNAIRPQRGGRAVTTGAISQSLSQSDNPSQPSRQTQDTLRTRTYAIPREFPCVPSVPSAPSLRVSDREEIHTLTELGAAQKDTARELGAKLSSLRGIVWVGLGLFVFGLASIFWPPLRAIIGSVTTSAAITLGGVGLMTLPTLVVGHELLILGGIALAVGGWFIAHRHGHARGQLAAASSGHASRITRHSS